VDEALACHRRALELKPDFAEAHSNLGVAFKDQGKLDEALACFRRALELKPDYAAAHSNLLYTQVFCPGYDPQTLYEEHRRWNRQHAEPLGKFIEPHPNDRSPQRRLRIGYLSPDFRRHPVGRFLLPLLESHDRENFEIFSYASVRIPDTMTDRCRAHTDVWRDVLGLPDEQVAHAIRQDRVDILVDLTMHMANNRLLVFARKPAPVQVTYLAYCGTTGLTTIDYRLSDPYLDPPGRDEPFYSEQTVHLPETYWCYRPPIETPPVNALPALEAGHVSFGSLNNFCKVTSAVLAAWGQLLQAVPGSRLLLHAFSGSHRDRARGFLAEQGIAENRVVFVDFLPTAEYLGVYRRIDVALDPFPYGGGTTTCDALWMGVPVVSLAGQTAVGRGGVSILSNLGLPELVAQDPEQYVRIAVELAHDLPRLSALRASLRERMQASPLMNAARFARNVEAAYRTMWQRWCAR
jgi:predicted O-linked N-acetylglucosamine transferase (SPINDLY family)